LGGSDRQFTLIHHLSWLLEIVKNMIKKG